jgi:hypothetical protein
MQQEGMTCLNCLYGFPQETPTLDAVECRFLPTPVIKTDDEWCGHGEWPNDDGTFAQWGGWENNAEESTPCGCEEEP